MRTIDLNCDMGESFGPWKMGDDEAIMPYITSANVACGAHAGDPDVMRATIRLAKRYGVAVGAHPGYSDLRGFGRRPLSLSHDELVNMILYQVGALWAIARSESVELHHVKPHGALYNQACADANLAGAIAEAVAAMSSNLILVGLPNSQLEAAARRCKLPFAREGFADRAYEPNGLLRDRAYDDSLIKDPARAAAHALQLVAGGGTAHNGAPLNLQVDTLCVHGDTPGAPLVARAVRDTLAEGGFTVASLPVANP